MATKLEPLAISCTKTDCDADLHCFLQKKRDKERHVGGPCRGCDVDLVVWERVQARNIADVAYTLEVQAKEYIRHEFWHREFDVKALAHARRKGRVRLREAAEKRIRSSVGRAENFHEGFQTSYKGNVIFYAQHALAVCCRKCIEYWHGIKFGRALEDDEVNYLTELVMLYVQARLPTLSDEPERIPRRRTARRKKAKT